MKYLFLLAALAFTPLASAQIFKAAETEAVAPSTEHYQAPKGKKIYIPKELQSNDFSNPNSKWCYKRSACTDDVIIFWERPFGDDLSKAPDLDGHPMTVDLDNLLKRIQECYDVYKKEMRFILPGSNADKYRMMVMLSYSLEGTAYGGDYDQVIGALWIAPNRVQDKRLNCIAHELGHSFQSMVACDGKSRGMEGGGIYEMCSQWMLFQMNPEWPTDENYHWRDFCRQANLRFLAVENIYHSCYVLEQWSQLHGLSVMADLWRAALPGEDPASTYMRMFRLSNEDFARECCDCYSRLLTFDFKGKHEQNKRYAGEFLNDQPLQTFGANSIRLDGERLTLKPGKTQNVTLLFNALGDISTDGYAYRLVAVNDRAEATYSPISTNPRAKLKFRVPADATALYLVVTGYPKGKYKPYLFNPYDRNSKPDAPAIYPYSYSVK